VSFSLRGVSDRSLVGAGVGNLQRMLPGFVAGRVKLERLWEWPLLAHSCCAERRNMRRLAEELRPLPTGGDMGAAFGRAGAHQVALESGQSSQNREDEPPLRGGGVRQCVGRATPPLSAICASVFKRSRVDRARRSRHNLVPQNPVTDFESMFALDSARQMRTKYEHKLRAQPWLTEKIRTDSKTQGR
jgi:hypothetical protein